MIGAFAIGSGGHVGATQRDIDSVSDVVAVDDPIATPIAEVPLAPTSEPVDYPSYPPEVPSGPFDTLIPSITFGSCSAQGVSSEVIARGATLAYGCDAVLAIDPLAIGESDTALMWSVTVTEITQGWDAALRAESTVDWTAVGTSGIVVLDGMDGTAIARFDLLVTAPSITDCGAPTRPVITLVPSAASVVGGVTGQTTWGTAVQPLQLTLEPSVPTVTLTQSRSDDAATVQPTFSHADQSVDVGVLTVTVTSGSCDGWRLLLHGVGGSNADGTALTLVLDAGQSDIPDDAVAELRVGHAPADLVRTVGSPLPPGSYSVVYRMSLDIPGGTPPGVYSTTLAVTIPAAP